MLPSWILLILLHFSFFYFVKLNTTETKKQILNKISIKFITTYLILFVIYIYKNNFESYSNVLTLTFTSLFIIILYFSFFYFSLKNIKTIFPKNINYKQILIASFLALIFGFIITFINNGKLNAVYFPNNYKFFYSIQGAFYLFFFYCLLPSIFEELYFRGHLFLKLENQFSNRFIIIFTSITFYFIHLINHEIESIIWLLSLGLILGIIRYKSRNIYPSITFHLVYNIFVIFKHYY